MRIRMFRGKENIILSLIHKKHRNYAMMSAVLIVKSQQNCNR